MSDTDPPCHALSGNHPATGRPVFQTLPDRCLDDAIARMASAGYRDICVTPDIAAFDPATGL